MKKIIIGAILMFLQVLAFSGNSRLDNFGLMKGFGVFAICFNLGYCAVGISGLILFILGLVSPLRKKSEIKKVEKEAYSKGMSIRQYVTSVVPSSLITFCEVHKGESSVLKKNLKSYIEENVITKRIAVVLLEMYK